MPTFGVMHDFRQRLPWTVPTSTYYAECLDLIGYAEELGYDAVWLSEHHGTADGFLPSPLVAAAAIAMRTTRMRIGTSVLLLPLHHPLRVAEDAAIVHALSGGRLVLGVGQGYAPHEFAALGVNRSHRPSRFVEGVEIIRRAWTEGRTGYDGKRYAIPDLPFEPRPPDPAPIYFGATTPESVDRAVRMADGLTIYVTEPERELPERYDVLAEARARHDRPDFPLTWTTMIHVDEDRDEAWAQAGPGLAYLESPLRSTPITPDELDRDALLVGTPDEVADRVRALYARAPFDHLAFWSRLPGLTVAQAESSLRLFMERVVPAVANG